MKKLLACFLLPLLVTAPVLAQDKTPEAPSQADKKTIEPNPEDNPVLKKLRAGNAKLAYDYLGHHLNRDVWLLSGPGIMQIIYLSENSPGAMIGGALIGEDGKEISSVITREFMTKYPERAQEIVVTVRSNETEEKTASKQAATSPSEILWDKLHQGGRILFGAEKGAPVVFAVMDPAQGRSHDLWKQFQPAIKEKKISLYILPLAVTNADGILEIAHILGGKNPQELWTKTMEGHSAVTVETPDSNGVLGMKANVELAQSLNLRNIPFIVYRGKEGKVRIINGVPNDWDKFMKEVTAR